MIKRCLNDNVLVREVTPEDQATPGGIILPGKGQAKRGTMAVVVLVGPGQKLDLGDQQRYRLDLIEGSIVLLAEKSGDPVIIDGKDYLIVPERYILAVVSESEKDEGDNCEPVPGYGMRDTPENREKIKHFNHGDCIPVDSGGNIMLEEKTNAK